MTGLRRRSIPRVRNLRVRERPPMRLASGFAVERTFNGNSIDASASGNPTAEAVPTPPGPSSLALNAPPVEAWAVCSHRRAHASHREERTLT